jgi:hypothetical protein
MDYSLCGSYRPPLLTLPADLLRLIFSHAYLPICNVVVGSLVCKALRQVLAKPLNHRAAVACMSSAAETGQIGLMQWLRERGCPWSHDVCAAAAAGAQLEALQWLRTQDPPCPISGAACTRAIVAGSISALRWLLESGAPLAFEALGEAAATGRLDILQLLWGRTLPNLFTVQLACARGGYLAMLQWVQEQDAVPTWVPRFCAEAIRYGHKEMLFWAVESGAPLEESCTSEGGLCPLPPLLISRAASMLPDLDLLRWLVDKRVPLGRDVSSNAAMKGSLEVSPPESSCC